MKTKQAVFLLGINIVFLIAAIIFFDTYQTNLMHLIQGSALGTGGGAGKYSIWEISVYVNNSVRNTVVMYSVIFFFSLAVVNILMIPIFQLWNKMRSK
jgi:hypothetical protein